MYLFCQKSENFVQSDWAWFKAVCPLWLCLTKHKISFSFLLSEKWEFLSKWLGVIQNYMSLVIVLEGTCSQIILLTVAHVYSPHSKQLNATLVDHSRLLKNFPATCQINAITEFLNKIEIIIFSFWYLHFSIK